MTYPDLTDYTVPTEEQLARDYTAAWQSVEAQLQRVIVKVQRAQRTGMGWSDAWASQQVSLDALLRQLQGRLLTITGRYPARLETRRRGIVAKGLQDAEAQLTALGIGQVQLPAVAFERLAYKRNLDQLFQSLGDAGAQRARQVLLAGMIQGKGPLTVARQLAQALNGNMARAQTIARTEMLQTYRASAIETYRENGVSQGGVVEAWNWVAEPDACEICMEAADGSPYQLEEDFSTHPNCRCYTEPVTVDTSEVLG